MISSLALGLGLFVAAWIVHAVVWRVRRPLAYPIWLPAIFISTPIGICLASLLVTAWNPQLAASAYIADFIITAPWITVAGLMLYFAIAACYTCGYAGIVEYSPSAEILQAVEKHMPHGIEMNELEVPSLTEQALTGKRIYHLMASRMIEQAGSRLFLTQNGKRVVGFWNLYRAVFGIKQGQ